MLLCSSSHTGVAIILAIPNAKLDDVIALEKKSYVLRRANERQK